MATIGENLQASKDFHIGVEQLAHTHNENQFIIPIIHNRNLFFTFLMEEKS